MGPHHEGRFHDNQVDSKPRPTLDGASRLRAVVYLRVSTNKQADKEMTPRATPCQRDACCVRQAEQLGARCGHRFDRGESAKTTDRPDFLRMVHRISGRP